MSFLSPLFLIGALTAAIPLVLHLLKREPELRVKFPAVALLKNATVEYTEKRRIRELLLLALRIAALLLLALAFARPFFAAGVLLASPGVTMIAVDTSASLSAPGRFERAKQLARAAVDRAPSGDLIGVVTFADAPTLVAKPSVNRAFARSAIDAATVGFGAARYRGAIGTAVQAFGERSGTIVFVTDLQENGWDAGDRASVPEATRIEVADVGSMAPNLAVTAVRGAGNLIVASVRNTGDAPRAVRAHLTLDDRRAGDATVTVGPRASAEIEFDRAARATTAVVAIDDPEGIQADNVRYAVLDGANRPMVLVVTATGDLGREALYVRQALLAGAADGKSYELMDASPAQLSTWDPARLSAHAAILLLSTRGLERRGREALAAFARGGGGVLIAAGPDVDGEVVADALGGETALHLVADGTGGPGGPGNPGSDDKVERALAPVDARHPIFQLFGSGAATLGLVRFHRLARIEGSGCQTIARFTTGAPALLECVAGEGRALVLASDLGGRWNDFPLHATFVPFLHETVRYLAGGAPQASEYLVGEVPSDTPARPGVAMLAGRGTVARGSRRIAVNVDPRESDPTRLSIEEFQAAVTRLKGVSVSEGRDEARDHEDQQHLWQYVLALMIGILAVEGVVASRTA